MIKVIKKIDDKIDLIQMKNDDLEVVVSNYGCTIVKVLMKDKDGNIDDVVLGYDDFRDYLFNSTKLDTPSTSRHDFGYLYNEDGEIFLKLNLQVRFC